jgi:hypothetical protein
MSEVEAGSSKKKVDEAHCRTAASPRVLIDVGSGVELARLIKEPLPMAMLLADSAPPI